MLAWDLNTKLTLDDISLKRVLALTHIDLKLSTWSCKYLHISCSGYTFIAHPLCKYTYKYLHINTALRAAKHRKFKGVYLDFSSSTALLIWRFLHFRCQNSHRAPTLLHDHGDIFYIPWIITKGVAGGCQKIQPTRTLSLACSDLRADASVQSCNLAGN